MAGGMMSNIENIAVNLYEWPLLMELTFVSLEHSKVKHPPMI